MEVAAMDGAETKRTEPCSEFRQVARQPTVGKVL
jgi:hypothetical protein